MAYFNILASYKKIKFSSSHSVFINRVISSSSFISLHSIRVASWQKPNSMNCCMNYIWQHNAIEQWNYPIIVVNIQPCVTPHSHTLGDFFPPFTDALIRPSHIPALRLPHSNVLLANDYQSAGCAEINLVPVLRALLLAELLLTTAAAGPAVRDNITSHLRWFDLHIDCRPVVPAGSHSRAQGAGPGKMA